MTLNLAPNLADHDGFYEALLARQKGMGEGEALAFNARLVMILANHIGDVEVLTEALELAARD